MSEATSGELKKSTNLTIQGMVRWEKANLEKKFPDSKPEIVNQYARGNVAKRIIRVRLRKEKETLREKILIDELTGLPNRKFFFMELARKINDSKRKGTSFFILVMDLNNFKTVNDIYGHAVGDKVLRTIKEIKTRENEPIARLSGDEFAQIINGDANEQTLLTVINRYSDEIKELSRNVLQKENKSFNETSQVLEYITLSIGASKFEKGIKSNELFIAADKALYEAKATKDKFFIGKFSNGNVECQELQA